MDDFDLLFDVDEDDELFIDNLNIEDALLNDSLFRLKSEISSLDELNIGCWED